MGFDMMSLLQNPMLQFGANLLAQSGPSLQPTSLGQSIGRAGLATGQGLMQAQQFAQQQALQKAQMDALAQAEADRIAQEEARANLGGFFGLPLEITTGLFRAYPDMMGDVIKSQLIPQQQAPMSTIGKLQADLQANRITPEQYQQAIAIMNKPLVQNLPAPPSGYYYKDPANPTAGLAAIGGGPADPATKAAAKAAESQGKVQSALGIVAQLEELALGENGIFKEFQPGGPLSRLGAGAKAMKEKFLQDDPRFATYQGVSVGVLAPIIKALGDSGNLAEGDVQRAIQSIPNLSGIPDTEEVARRKLKTLREILGNVSPEALRAAQESVGRPPTGLLTQPPAPSMPPPPPGFIMEQ